MLAADCGDRQRSLSFASATTATEYDAAEHATSGACASTPTPTPTPAKLAKMTEHASETPTASETSKDAASLIPACWEPNWDTSVYKRKKNCKKRRDPMEPQKYAHLNIYRT